MTINKKVLTSTYIGVDSYLVEVEVDISNGLPIFSIIGMGDTAIAESKFRVKAALKNNKIHLTPKRIVVNLSPAGIRKEGAQFDLPIAIGIMKAINHITDKYNRLDNYLFIGELSLNGEIKPVKGVVNFMIMAKEHGYEGVVLPFENLNEASLIEGVKIIPVNLLTDVIEFFNCEKVQESKMESLIQKEVFQIDFLDVKGQAHAKRGMEIAAAGGHNIILIGTPGSGKSMLGKRIVTILPPMNDEEIIESTKIHSIAGKLTSINPIVVNRPYRSPHHTTSIVAMIGGGTKLMPGEISLASNGVLMLDEISEFNKTILESLRQPLEDKMVSITRAQYRAEFKANFMLVATSNPCYCGYLFENRCKCNPYEISNYEKRLSGPILDRIDLYVEMRRLTDDELLDEESVSESSTAIKERVIKAREIQNKRYKGNKKNCDMNHKEVKKFCKIPEKDKLFFKRAIEKLGISGRSYYKLLKVARTIADLNGEVDLTKEHLLESISYRKKQKKS